MVFDAFRGYLQLVTGLSEVTRQRAMAAVRALAEQGGVGAEQMAALAEELVAASRTNRDALVELVGAEIDHALGRLGLASAEELAALEERVGLLEARLGAAEGGRGGARRDPAATGGAAGGKAAPSAGKDAGGPVRSTGGRRRERGR